MTKIRQSTIWYAGLLVRWDEWLVEQASDVNWIEKIVITPEFYFTKIRDSVAIAAGS